MRFACEWRSATARTARRGAARPARARRLSELGVPRPAVSVERVDALERSPGGKLQIVVGER